MRLFKLLVFLFILSPFASLAQQIVTGTVKDSKQGIAIENVHIRVGKQITTTNAKGEYKVEVEKPGNYLVVVSAVGYKPQQSKVTAADEETTNVNFVLEVDDIFIDEVVVTATRTEGKISDIPGRVEVVTPERINLVSYQSVDELLALLPGVQTSRSFGLFSFRSTVSMRGVSAKEQARTLVLLNGVPVNKADGGSVNWNLISTGEIERIEVIKGPGSALYGGNAMGGIINVVTKKPTKIIEGSVSAHYATYNTKGVNAKFAGKLKNGFYWSANGLFRNSDGYITQSPAEQQENPYIVNSTFEEKVMHFKTGFDGGEKFSAEVDFTFFDDVRTTGEQVYQTLGNTREYDTYQLRSVFKGGKGNFSWNASAFFQREHYKRVSEWFKDDYTWYDVLSLRSDYGLLTSANYKFANHSITGGVDVRLGEVDASDVYYTSPDRVDNSGKMDFYGFYLQDVVGFFDNWLTITAGIRYDFARFYEGEFAIYNPSAETNFMDQYQFSGQDPVSWGAFSPRISAQFKPSHKYRVYASYSRGFRPSVLDDLCRSGRVRGGFKVANEKLTPEYLNNFEIGGDYKPTDWARIAASAFYSKGKDFLYYVSTGDSIDMGFVRPIMIPANISGVNIIGFETDFSATPIRNLTVFGSYAFAQSKITQYNPKEANIGLPDDYELPKELDLTGNFLTDVPMHSFSLGAFFRHHWVNASLTSRYVGQMYINDLNAYDDWVLSNRLPAAFTVDLRLSRELLNHVEVSLSVQNILDKKIIDSSLSVGPGRFVTLEVKAKI